MKKTFILLFCVLLINCSRVAPENDLEIKGKNLISKKPPFSITLSSEFELIHSSSVEYPKENSLTRTYLCTKKNENQAEEILIIQIADRTNPQAEPINAPPLSPESEKRMYLKGEERKKKEEVNYLIQLIAWNPDAPSLRPLREKGIGIPSHWAIQGQFLFIYQGEHAVLIRYSKDVNTFGLKVSEKGEDWEKVSISGNEKKVHDLFQKSAMEMIDSIQIRNP